MITVLLVDDTPEILELLKISLDSEELTCMTAPSGVQAEFILKHNNIDFIISDYEMDNGDGNYLYETNKAYKKPFAFHSGSLNTNLKNIEISKEVKTYFFDKPTDIELISKTISEHFSLQLKNQDNLYSISSYLIIKYFEVIDDVYIRIGKEKYILLSRRDFKNKSSVIRLIKEKGIQEFYINPIDFKKVYQSISTSKPLNTTIEMELEVISTYASIFIPTQEEILHIRKQLKETVSRVLNKENATLKLIKASIKADNFLLSHSILASFIASRLLTQCQLNERKRQETFFTAYFLHDLNKDSTSLIREKENLEIKESDIENFSSKQDLKLIELTRQIHEFDHPQFLKKSLESKIFIVAHLSSVIILQDIKNNLTSSLANLYKEKENFEQVLSFIQSISN